MNIAETILSHGDDAAPCLLTQKGVSTYCELRRQVRQIACALLARGHCKGDRIGIFAENSPFFVAAYFRIIRAGLVAVPLQTELSLETLARTARDAGMSAVLASPRLANRATDWVPSASRCCLPLPAKAGVPSAGGTPALAGSQCATWPAGTAIPVLP